jgi:hypothetical protein
VLDAVNDLACLGDLWPQSSNELRDTDKIKADNYFSTTETIIWTPGRETGNPLFLSPLPDFSVMRNDQDELNHTIFLAHNALSYTVAAGVSVKAQKKLGVLLESLCFFANNSGGDLLDFIELLSDLPSDAGGGISDSDQVNSTNKVDIKNGCIFQ